MSPLFIFALCVVIGSTNASILMPHSYFTTRSGMVSAPPQVEDSGDVEVELLPSDVNINQETNEEDNKAYQQEHTRNCFFTPVQCMLPLTDSHKNIQSLHGVYSPTATHVRRSVDFTSPWGYTDLIKRGGDNRFYQWLGRF